MKAMAVLVTTLAATVLSAAAVSAQMVPPPTLTGETLTGTGPATSTTSATCNPTGTSTFTYQTSGAATGPYNGTFTESGTVTIGPQTFSSGVSAPTGLITSWTATFTITSATGTVTGTKTLLPPPTGQTATASGICQDGTTGFPAQQSANNFFQPQRLGYTATITLADGDQFRDTGTSGASENTTPLTPQANNFIENYVSQQTTTIPLCDQNSQLDQNQNDNDQGCVNP